MDALSLQRTIVTAALLGLAGQGIRVLVGLKKQSDKAHSEKKTLKQTFSARKLLVSLAISFALGGIAGMLGAVANLGAPLDKTYIITMLSIGYAGTDFIEGFMGQRK